MIKNTRMITIGDGMTYAICRVFVAMQLILLAALSCDVAKCYFVC